MSYTSDIPKTPKLGAYEITQTQARKYETFNKTLFILDVFCQLIVKDKDLTAPPGSPSHGDTYILNGASGTGLWANFNQYDVIVWNNDESEWWAFTPRDGWMAHILDEGPNMRWFNGSYWQSAGGP